MLSVGIIPVGFNDGTSDGIDDTEGPLLGVLVTFDGLGDGSLLVEGLSLGCAEGLTPLGLDDGIPLGLSVNNDGVGKKLSLGLGDGSLLVEGLPLGCAVGFTPDGFSEIIAEGVADPVGALVFPSWQSAMLVTAPDPLR